MEANNYSNNEVSQMKMDQYYTMDGALLYGVCQDETPSIHPCTEKPDLILLFVFAGTFAKHNLPLRHHPGTLRQISKGRCLQDGRLKVGQFSLC